jgi:hypothetical protein
VRKLVALAIATAAVARTPEAIGGACPACSNPNLPTAESTIGDAAQATATARPRYEVAAAVAPLPRRLLVLALTTDFTTLKSSHVEGCPDIGPACASLTPPPAYDHNLRTYAYGLTIDAQYGVLPWLTLAATAPYRFVTTRIHYTDLAGSPYDPTPPDTHHRDETVTGFADPTVALVAGDAIDRFGFSVRLGAMLPLGRTLDVDPFEAGRLGIVHEHIQFGVGTVRPIAGSALGYDFGPAGVDAFFQGTMAVATNAIGYRPGQRLSGGVRATSALGIARARFGVGAEMLHESTETWQGLQQEEGNLGRTDIVGVLSARYSPWVRLGVFGAIKVPLYVSAVGAQLSYPFVLQLGIATGLPL